MNSWIAFLIQVLGLVSGMKFFSVDSLIIKQSILLLIISQLLIYFIGTWSLLLFFLILFFIFPLTLGILIPMGTVIISLFAHYFIGISNFSGWLASSLQINIFMILISLGFVFLKKNPKMLLNLNMSLLSLIIWTLLMLYIEILINAYLGFSGEILILRGSLLLTYLLFLGFLLWNMSKMMQAKRKIELEKAQLEHKRKEDRNLRLFWENIERSNEKLRQSQHDYRNTLLMLQGLMEAQDQEGMKHYFKENISNLNKAIFINDFKASQLRNLKVPELKSLVESKLAEAQQSNIDFQLEVAEPIETVPIAAISLGKAVGILLDNGLDEIRELGKGQVRAAFIQEESFLWIIITNHCKIEMPTVRQMFQKGFSTKGENRGFGLDNINQLLAEHDQLELRTFIKNGIFEQHLKLGMGWEINARDNYLRG